MRRRCYTVRNISKLWLSPYVKVSRKEDGVVLTQLMFRTAVQLEGPAENVAECLNLLEGGVDGDEFRRWGEGRFPGFSAWVDCAIRAGVIE